MKVFISASSGVGKSAVINELKKRGYTAYDADDRGLQLTRLEDRSTGRPIDWPKGFIDWSKYGWNANEERLRELLESSDTVFLAGFLGNQESLYHYFDKLIVLTVDPTEHERRLRTRPKREYGDEEEHIIRRLEKYPLHLEKFASSGFEAVDNSGSIKTTVDRIQQVSTE